MSIAAMETTTEVLVKGKVTRVAAIAAEGHQVVVEGSLLKIAQVFDEIWQEKQPVTIPERFIDAVRERGLDADLFTFAQTLPHTRPAYDYHHKWDNLAVAGSADYQEWWESLPQESRKNVRKCLKRGIVVKPVPFTDELVHGIKGIYDETPLRQGRRFWHYGKDFETVKRQNASYLERSQFIAAYLGEELIGFIKIVYTGEVGRIMQILSKNRHYDKHPMNALVACAMEECARRQATHLIYGQYVYGNKRNSSVTEFKRRNGFVEVLLPRYYIPLTIKGRMALAMGLHRELGEVLPEPLINFMLETRAFAYNKVLSRFGGVRMLASAN